MSTNARWIIGILLALVIGLTVGLVIVAGDAGDDEAPTLQTETEETDEVTTAVEPQPPIQTETTPDGGISPPPTPPKPDGSGGLGQ